MYNDCQFIGFFDNTFTNSIFDQFDKVDSDLIITKVSRYDIINEEKYYKKIEKSQPFYCGKLIYGKTRQLTFSSHNAELEEISDDVVEHYSLPGEYVIVGNTKIPVCVIDYKNKEKINEYKLHPDIDETYKRYIRSIYSRGETDSIKEQLIRYLLSKNIDNQTGFTFNYVYERQNLKLNVNIIDVELKDSEDKVIIKTTKIIPMSITQLMDICMEKVSKNEYNLDGINDLAKEMQVDKHNGHNEQSQVPGNNDQEQLAKRNRLEGGGILNTSNNFYLKYLKYKQKYLELKKLME
jgi:hypothetical protein